MVPYCRSQPRPVSLTWSTATLTICLVCLSVGPLGRVSRAEHADNELADNDKGADAEKPEPIAGQSTFRGGFAPDEVIEACTGQPSPFKQDTNHDRQATPRQWPLFPTSAPGSVDALGRLLLNPTLSLATLLPVALRIASAIPFSHQLTGQLSILARQIERTTADPTQTLVDVMHPETLDLNLRRLTVSADVDSGTQGLAVKPRSLICVSQDKQHLLGKWLASLPESRNQFNGWTLWADLSYVQSPETTLMLAFDIKPAHAPNSMDRALHSLERAEGHLFFSFESAGLPDPQKLAELEFSAPQILVQVMEISSRHDDKVHKVRAEHYYNPGAEYPVAGRYQVHVGENLPRRWDYSVSINGRRKSLPNPALGTTRR